MNIVKIITYYDYLNNIKIYNIFARANLKLLKNRMPNY